MPELGMLIEKVFRLERISKFFGRSFQFQKALALKG